MPAPKDPIKRVEWIEKIKVGCKGKKYPNRKKPPPFTKEHKQHLQEIHNRPEVKQKNREATIKQWEDLEFREKQRIARVGTHPSEETKQKMRGPRPHIRGENNPRFGKQGTLYGRLGEDHPCFRGVEYPREYHWTWNDKLRAEVRERDNHTCQLCGQRWVEGERLFDTHHIYGPEDNDQPCDMTKLITLDHKCHEKIKADFEHYIPQFEEIIRRRS